MVVLGGAGVGGYSHKVLQLTPIYKTQHNMANFQTNLFNDLDVATVRYECNLVSWHIM